MGMEDCRIAEQVAEWNPQGLRRRAADQSVHWRLGLRTACKGENLRMKNVSIGSSGGKKLCLWVEENYVPTEKLLHIYIYNSPLSSRYSLVL
jgi:hypothetical protein